MPLDIIYNISYATGPPNSGMMTFDPPEWDEKLGSWIQLPQKGK